MFYNYIVIYIYIWFSFTVFYTSIIFTAFAKNIFHVLVKNIFWVFAKNICADAALGDVHAESYFCEYPKYVPCAHAEDDTNISGISFTINKNA